MRYVTTRSSRGADLPVGAGARDASEPSAEKSGNAGVTLAEAMLDGLGPDGGLFMPERISEWRSEEVGALRSMTLPAIASRVLAPFVGDELSSSVLAAVATAALDFPVPLVEVEPDVYALELFHGPTLAFKDVAARVMARLFAAFEQSSARAEPSPYSPPPSRCASRAAPLTVLVATSGDTGGAVAHAFAGVPGMRVIVLYPEGRVSPTQEAQLVMFNGEVSNVRAFAVAGTFDDCQRLVKAAFADRVLRGGARVTSANSINVGRLLPQMIYYFHAIGRLQARVNSQSTTSVFAAPGLGRTSQRAALAVCEDPTTWPLIATPSGNFGNLTAGVMAKRAGLPVARFIAATNVNDVVPTYLRSGLFEPRASIATIANAMDVGNPSNFERLLWLYRGDVDAMRAEIAGSVHAESEIRDTIRRVYETRGYLFDPHSAIAYLAVTRATEPDAESRPKIFLATAHPAKFREIVEPIVGRTIEVPSALAAALETPRHVLRLDPDVTALRNAIL